MVSILSPVEFAQITASAMLTDDYSVVTGNNYLVVDLRQSPALPDIALWPACVVIGLTETVSSECDVCAANDTELALLIDAVQAQPEAAATLVQLLRHNERCNVADGLLAESLAYSTLQQSRGFHAWLQSTQRPRARMDNQPPLLLERHTVKTGARLLLTLNRPDAHNAYSTALKDALCEALQLADMDNAITEVVLQGNGPSFCAGGDLSEFGSVTDAGIAHLSRTTRSAAVLLDKLRCGTSARLHGACIGAGIELPAFTGHITAKDDSFFQLPEVAMGLVPGAGGTVSVLKRIGRQRTAWMALSNQRIDAQQALDWGLVDDVIA